MDIEYYLLFNSLPLFGAFFMTAIACTIVFQKLKLRWPIKVNCWFCNINTKVSRQEKNWWLCPSCHQYNGFSENGDYAYDIPEQYNVSLNNSKVSSFYQKNISSKAFANGLCKECNDNEKLKVSKLNSFEPTNNKTYHSEVIKFKNFLEKKYPLCTTCKLKVRNVLYEQALWLSRYKLLSFTQKPIRVIIQNGQKLEKIGRIIQTAIASGLIYNTDYWLLPVSGVFFQLCSHFISSKKATLSNMLTTLLWMCLVTLSLPKDVVFSAQSEFLNFFALEETVRYHTNIMLLGIICLLNLQLSTYTNKPKSPVILKKLSTNHAKNVLPEMCSFDKKSDDTYKKNVQTEGLINCKSPEIPTDSMKAPYILQLNSKETTIPVRNSSGMENESFTSWRGSFLENSTYNNSLNDLSSLSLSNSHPRSTSKTPKIFEKRTYGTTSPDLFAKLTNVTQRRHVLAPPKLKSVTQTSWVAGGYWQEAMPVPTLSRSSSQSSGFDSAGSNFNPSKEPSVYDFDRCSVASDATLSCSASRRNSPNIHKSFDRHCPSPCSFVKPYAVPRSQTCQFSPTYSCFQQHMMMPHGCTGKTVYNEPSAHHQGVNDAVKLEEKSNISHNHAWLSTLLCGSLVVNIIVLCITLLR